MAWGGVLSMQCRIVIFFRLSSFFKRRNGFFSKLIYCCLRMVYKHYQLKTGIQLPIGTTVGKGLFFPHWSCIIINGDAVIGDWCTIYQGVTIGRSSDGKTPVVGNNCTIYAGAKIIGGIMIGNKVTIGANSVVTKDVPDEEVWVGIPARNINSKQ